MLGMGICNAWWQRSLYHSSSVNPIKMAFYAFNGNGNPNVAPLIIMHGLLGSKKNWRGISRVLSLKLNQKIYCVDARNHGDSPHDPKHSSEDMAEDVVAFMRQENITRAAVMGHSMGGRTMMYFALKYPELVERAIIVDISPISIPRDIESMGELFLAMKNISVPLNTPMTEGRRIVEKQIKDTVGDQGTVDFIIMNLKRLESGKYVWQPNVAALYENLKHFNNYEETISVFQPYLGPVMFIGGKRSNFLNSTDWPAITKIFPNFKHHWLDAGHLVHFDQPVEFVKVVCDFMKEQKKDVK